MDWTGEVDTEGLLVNILSEYSLLLKALWFLVVDLYQATRDIFFLFVLVLKLNNGNQDVSKWLVPLICKNYD